MNTHHLVPALSLVLCLACTAPGSQGSQSHYNLARGGLAISGFDPVGYFPEGGGSSQEGLETLPVVFRGAEYRFVNEANRQTFLGDPQRFEPRYGGWCAWAMIDGEKVGIDPQSFLIEEGGLYLFYDGWFADTREMWSEKGGAIARPVADEQWTALSRMQAERLNALEVK